MDGLTQVFWMLILMSAANDDFFDFPETKNQCFRLLKTSQAFCKHVGTFQVDHRNTAFACMDAVFVEKQTDVTKRFSFCLVVNVRITNRSQNYFD